MKAVFNGLLQGRVARWGLFAGCLVALGLATGWRSPQYQLGGTWIGVRDDGFVWTCNQIPIDPAGKRGIVRVEAAQWTRSYVELVNAMGGDDGTDPVGEVKMISQDTAKWKMILYEKNTTEHVITGIDVYEGTFQFTSPDTAVLDYSLKVYMPSADADGDGFPDAGATPVVSIPQLVDTAKRVTVD